MPLQKVRAGREVGGNHAKDRVRYDKYGDWRQCPSALSSTFCQTAKKKKLKSCTKVMKNPTFREIWGIDALWQSQDLLKLKWLNFVSHFTEPKDKATLFKGYLACLFSSHDGASFYIVDWRNAAWWNVPVKLPECNALNMEEFPHDQTSHSCHEHLKELTAFSAWIWCLILRWELECKIRIRLLQKCNRSQRESRCQRALPLGMFSCLDGRSDEKSLWSNVLIGRANKIHKETSLCMMKKLVFNKGFIDEIV